MKNLQASSLVLSVTSLVVALLALAMHFKFSNKSSVGIPDYSFATPKDAIRSVIRLNQEGSFVEMQAANRRFNGAGDDWNYSLLDQDSVDIAKTVEVSGAHDGKLNGRVLCFLTLRCPDGIERHHVQVLSKSPMGDFTHSYFPTYVSDEAKEASEGRYSKMIKAWEERGVFEQ